ncbi:hypothetical protein LOTGIDRAFT_225501 [Lottia gigantea]|uniref:Peptidase S1 domain-containing protein n=1 Tax=Lottia gigantea TaxID=225164 RepID=V4B521_LOTGI|nr:hypothetical protein LOTGIDRAFT_225501 [Lottia gigantea]ESP01072.1 hypothetical protein LOTGIDRAFT_225501 [Lottia gigantea]
MMMILLFVCIGLAASSPLERIVNGADAYYGEFPSQAGLLIKSSNSHICGGVLVSRRYVLTAAHCVGQSASYYRIVLGRHRRNNADSAEQYLDVTRITIHPGYNPNGAGFPNDMAMLELSADANTGSNYISTISLAETNDDFTGQTCTISGWGRLVGGGSLANTLQKVEMTQISNAQCLSAMTNVGNAAILSSHICVQTSGKSACNGDSGGPMYCNGKLAGITSWVVGSCLTSYPSVYGRVSSFRSFIDPFLN